LAAYRDWSLGELGLKVSSINSRLRIIIRFYRFGLNKGWIDSLPYDIETIRVRQPKGFLAHTDASGGLKVSPNVMLKTQPTEIRVLSRQQVKVLLMRIENPTLLLITRLALATGMRKEELATFPVSYVIETAQHDLYKEFIRVKLDPKTMKIKGGKERSIDIPIRMMEDLRQYVIHRRSSLETLSGEVQLPLFLNKQGQPWADGGRGLNNLYRRLSLPFKLTPHVLRHTYATHTLYGLRERQSRFDPLLYVRDRLGHSSVSTTEKYLHLLSEVEDDLMTNYQQEIDALFT
jgi:integrase